MQDRQKQTKMKRVSVSAVTAVYLLAFCVPFITPHLGAADSLSELRSKTVKLEKKIDTNKKQAQKLKKRGNTLKSAIKELNLKIDSLNAKIRLTSAKIATLDKELKKAERELENRKELLSQSMQALYKRGGVSTVELLVGSDSFSEFIDEQEYLERLKINIQDATEQIVSIKLAIQYKKEKQEDLRKQQQSQKDLLQDTKNQQAKLLAETRGQESVYRQKVSKLRKQQAKLLAEIVSRSQVIKGLGTGAYPWAHYKGKSWSHAASCGYGNDIDPWGYCYRQCVSYVAWKLYSKDKKPPVGYGNATNWAAAAKADGIKTGSNPKKGAVAAWFGAEGHVAYVEEVYGNGQVRVSEYNAVPALQGKYSQRIMSKSSPDTYIYFEKHL